MSFARGLVTAAADILLFATIVCAQGQNPASSTRSTIAVTGVATADRVRFTAPSMVVQMHLEVYAVNGEKLFDNEIRGGNVIDWHLQNGKAEPLPDGAYLCVVTVKTLSGRITQRIASATVEKTVAVLQTATASQLTPQQSGAVGPIEDDASLILLREDDNQTPTVIAHDGEDGQITRGRGALSFRLGDFFNGKATEQMRLTPDGNLGIGVANPQAKLDVAGAIHASQGIIFPDGSIQFSAARKTFGMPSIRDGQSNDKSGDGQGIRPEIAGTGTTGKIPKWQDGATGVLTDSVISELNGSIGINGPPSPTFKLDVNGHNRFRGSNVSFYLTGTKPGGNEWLFQTVDAEGRLRIFENSTGGGEKLSLTQSGNVGIGTSNPGAKLDAAGDINTSTQYNIGGYRVFIARPDGLLNIFAGVQSGQNATGGQGNSFYGYQTGFSNTGNDNSFFGRHSAPFNDTGTNNSAYGANSARANTMGSNNNFLGFYAGSNNTSGSNNTFIGANSGLSNTVENNNTFLGNGANGATGITNATAIGFQASVAQSNSLVLGSINTVNGATADTNVGIGTTSPASRLHVMGAGINSEGNTDLLITGTGTLASGITLASTGTGGHTYSWLSANGVGIGGGKLTLFDQTNFAFPLVIDGAGDVGIGTTSPAKRLHVQGAGSDGAGQTDLRITGTGPTASGITLESTGTGGRTYSWLSTAINAGGGGAGAGRLAVFDVTAGVYRMVIDGAGNVGIGTFNPDRTLSVNGSASKVGGGSWDVFSDERLKTIKGRFTPGLAAVMQLQPIRYEYRPDNEMGIRSSGDHIGFGAQAVQKIIPEAVTQNDRGYLLVNNDPIIWTMLNAIKEQQQQILELRREIVSFKTRTGKHHRRAIVRR